MEGSSNFPVLCHSWGDGNAAGHNLDEAAGTTPGLPPPPPPVPAEHIKAQRPLSSCESSRVRALTRLRRLQVRMRFREKELAKAV